MKYQASFLLLLVMLCFSVACKKETKTSTLPHNTSETPKLKAVFINGDSLHYTDFGTGEPVIFVHGSLGNYTSWSAQVDTFATQYRVIAYSRRYHHPNKTVYIDTVDYSAAIHAKDLATLIKTLDLGPIHLVGHSWGAYTALKTTIDNPELVKTLTLGEPPVHALIENTKLGDSLIANLYEYTLNPSANAFKSHDDTRGTALFINGVMNDSLLYSKVSEQTKARWKQNTTELKGLVTHKSFLNIPPTAVQQVMTPTMVIKGDRSPEFLQLIATKLDSLLPNSQLFTLPNASHGLQNENPKVFNETVLLFIDNH